MGTKGRSQFPSLSNRENGEGKEEEYQEVGLRVKNETFNSGLAWVKLCIQYMGRRKRKRKSHIHTNPNEAPCTLDIEICEASKCCQCWTYGVQILEERPGVKLGTSFIWCLISWPE